MYFFHGKQILLHIYCHKEERRYCCIFRLDCSADGLLLPLAVHMPEAAGVWRTQKCAAQCVGGFCSVHDAAHGYWLHRQFRLLCLVYFKKAYILPSGNSLAVNGMHSGLQQTVPIQYQIKVLF